MLARSWLCLVAAAAGACGAGEPSNGEAGNAAGSGTAGAAGAAGPPGGTGAAGTGGAAAHGGVGAGASSGTGGATNMITLKGPIDRGEGKLVLELGDTRFQVTPEHGARISSLQHAGQELLVLTGSPNFDDAVGSTFWPSPQRWPWPPPAEIDSEPYAPTIDARGVITLVGQPHEGTGLRVTKTFTANLAREAIELSYAMTNVTQEPVSWAPWEITRMPATGLAFWPTGGAPYGDQPLVTETAHGQTWCAPGKTSGEGKLFADGSGGYLAYAVGSHILIKHFLDTPPSQAAPGEAEIELYVNADHSYFEVENQGAYASIAPGATVTWRVTWYARRLPPGVNAAAPHADLVAFVTKTLQ